MLSLFVDLLLSRLLRKDTSKKDGPDTIWTLDVEQRRKVHLNGPQESGDRFCFCCVDPH